MQSPETSLQNIKVVWNSEELLGVLGKRVRFLEGFLFQLPSLTTSPQAHQTMEAAETADSQASEPESVRSPQILLPTPCLGSLFSPVPSIGHQVAMDGGSEYQPHQRLAV